MITNYFLQVFVYYDENENRCVWCSPFIYESRERAEEEMEKTWAQVAEKSDVLIRSYVKNLMVKE